MRIVFDGIIYSLQKNGGISRYIGELINGLARSGESIDIVLHNAVATAPQFDAAIKITSVSSLPTVFSSGPLKYALYPLDALLGEKKFASYNTAADIFHSSYYTAYRSLRIPQVVTVHDLVYEKFPELQSLKTKLLLRYKREAIKRANGIICVSDQTRQDLEKFYDVSAKKITTIYHGVSAAFLGNVPNYSEQVSAVLKTKTPYLFFVGTRGDYKNFEQFIKSFAAWQHHQNYSVVVVGGGAFTKQESALLQHLKIEMSVACLAMASDEELAYLYKNAAALVYPSKYEGFGLPIIEAMSMGTLVICSDIPLFHEIGQNIPLFIDSNKKESFWQAFDAIAVEKNNSVRQESGIQRAHEFTWAACVEKTRDFYRQLIK